MSVNELDQFTSVLRRWGDVVEELTQAKTRRVMIICGTVALCATLAATCYLAGYVL